MRLAFAVTLSCSIVLCRPVEAQNTTYGLIVGWSPVGGGDSRTLVDMGGTTVTGGDRAGLHLRGLVDIPMSSTPFSFRGEVFFNRLTSNPDSYALVGNGTGQAALTDRTLGITGSLIARTARDARLTPYFSLGAGVFSTSLGSNPDPTAREVSMTRSGMGLGLAVGGGLEWRLGANSLLFDWRYYQGLYNTRGSSFMPVSIGLKLQL